VYGESEGWVQPVILSPLAAPPAALVRAPGARLVTVSAGAAQGVSPAVGHPGLILAWARIPAGGWACLLVWDGFRTPPGAREPAPSARWSWARWRADVVMPLRPWLPDQPVELRWFGRPHGGAFEAAFHEAAASLPQGMREAALERAAYEGAPEG
jgi:hypothetical protein